MDRRSALLGVTNGNRLLDWLACRDFSLDIRCPSSIAFTVD
jgi:hypothetical protein